jgi:NADH dehydrogenase FAD-containing subunit
VLILGGGFGSMYAALEFEEALALGDDLDVTLVNCDNLFLFTSMLHEVASSDLDITNIVSPIRKLLHHGTFLHGDIESISLQPTPAKTRLSGLSRMLWAPSVNNQRGEVPDGEAATECHARV